MTLDPAEFDDHGQWIGTCQECGTSHGGYPPGTYGAVGRCLRARSEALGLEHLVDQLDALDRDVAAARDRFLRDAGLIP